MTPQILVQYVFASMVAGAAALLWAFVILCYVGLWELIRK